MRDPFGNLEPIIDADKLQTTMNEKKIKLPQLFTKDIEAKTKEKRNYDRFVKEAVHLPTDIVHKDPNFSCSVVIPQNYNYHSDVKFNSI